MLLHEVWKIVEPLPVKPVITSALIIFMAAVHYFTDLVLDLTGVNFYDVSRYCLHPRKCFEAAYSALSGGAGTWQLFNFMPRVRESKSFPWMRILTSGFIHADDQHLYYNMISFCAKGVQLEAALGPEKYGVLVLYSLVVSHGIAIVLSRAMFDVAPYVYTHFHYILPSDYDSCAVGFSAVIFALKYVVNVDTDTTSRVHMPMGGLGFGMMGGLMSSTLPGLNIPTRHLCWAELVLIHYLSPNSSFVGHVSGILAGMLWVHVGGVAGWLRRKVQMRSGSGSGGHRGNIRYTERGGSRE